MSFQEAEKELETQDQAFTSDDIIPETKTPITLVLCIGSPLRADDGAGVLLQELIEKKPIEGIEAVEGGTVPENASSYIRRVAPEELILVDAAEMGLEPGTIRKVHPDDIAEQLFITTHSLPLSFLINRLEEAVGKLTFIGIQPQTIELFEPLSGAVSDAVDTLYEILSQPLEDRTRTLDAMPYSRDEE